MKICISALPLTIGVILQFGVSSSMMASPARNQLTIQDARSDLTITSYERDRHTGQIVALIINQKRHELHTRPTFDENGHPTFLVRLPKRSEFPPRPVYDIHKNVVAIYYVQKFYLIEDIQKERIDKAHLRGIIPEESYLYRKQYRDAIGVFEEYQFYDFRARGCARCLHKELETKKNDFIVLNITPVGMFPDDDFFDRFILSE